MMLWAQLNFVADMCEPILSTIGNFESQKPCTLIAYDKLEELIIAFEANALTVQVMDKYHQLHDSASCDELNLSLRSKNLELFQAAFEAAADKLHKYLSEEECGQPAIKFLKAVRIFDPSRFQSLSDRSQSY